MACGIEYMYRDRLTSQVYCPLLVSDRKLRDADIFLLIGFEIESIEGVTAIGIFDVWLIGCIGLSASK